jgi:hypothetical protein
MESNGRVIHEGIIWKQVVAADSKSNLDIYLEELKNTTNEFSLGVPCLRLEPSTLFE